MRAAVLAAFLLTAGCFEAHVRDERTITDIQKTIDNREADYARWLKIVANPSSRDINGQKLLHQSEIDRLKAWKWREEQKR